MSNVLLMQYVVWWTHLSIQYSNQNKPIMSKTFPAFSHVNVFFQTFSVRYGSRNPRASRGRRNLMYDEWRCRHIWSLLHISFSCACGLVHAMRPAFGRQQHRIKKELTQNLTRSFIRDPSYWKWEPRFPSQAFCVSRQKQAKSFDFHFLSTYIPLLVSLAVACNGDDLHLGLYQKYI